MVILADSPGLVKVRQAASSWAITTSTYPVVAMTSSSAQGLHSNVIDYVGLRHAMPYAQGMVLATNIVIIPNVRTKFCIINGGDVHTSQSFGMT